TNHDQDRAPMGQPERAGMSAVAYLQSLNLEQRSAVEHGVVGRGANIAGPLLVIAGAGSGKTNTLAHRAAHLIVNGADPARLLLLTFSRRAAPQEEEGAVRPTKTQLAPTQAQRVRSSCRQR